MGDRRIRYAVVGLGHLAQVAVLPAFAHASRNSELTALISGDPAKLKKLTRMYDVERRYSYDGYEEALASGSFDAIYIVLPNNQHREYAVRAANAGIHVICEKPMAVTARDCAAMIKAAKKSNVRLMVAYRLHFEEANLRAIQIAQSGRLGELRLFSSTFTMNVREGDIRVRKDLGGGPLYDIGVYCINAARYLFQDEPIEVEAMTATRSGDARFAEIEEMISCTLRFPGERLATFTCSFGASDASDYRIVGTKGDLRLAPAYDYSKDLKHHLTIGGKTTEKLFPKRDQFAAELLYFSDCLLNETEPEPSGEEGLHDVTIVEALHRAARSGRPVKLALPEKSRRPSLDQKITRPALSKVPKAIHAAPPKR